MTCYFYSRNELLLNLKQQNMSTSVSFKKSSPWNQWSWWTWWRWWSWLSPSSRLSCSSRSRFQKLDWKSYLSCFHNWKSESGRFHVPGYNSYTIYIYGIGKLLLPLKSSYKSTSVSFKKSSLWNQWSWLSWWSPSIWSSWSSWSSRLSWFSQGLATGSKELSEVF